MKFELTMNDPMRAKQFFMDKVAFTTGPVELDYAMKHNGKMNIVDVRAAEDYAKEHIPGAMNLPEDEWHTLKGLKKDQLNIVYCYTQVCHLAARAGIHFAGEGFPVMELEGGFETWKEHGLELESGEEIEQPTRMAG